MANNINSSNSTHEIDPKKNYTKVRFQQGKPILDVDLNDISSVLEHQNRNVLIEKMGYGPAQLDYRDFAITAVDPNIPLSDRNKGNFAFTLGRLDTHLGVVDTASYKGDGLDSRIIFDTHQITAGGGTDAGTDRIYSNYLLKGTVTSTSSGGNNLINIKDTSLNFSNLNLTGFDDNITIDPAYASFNSQVNTGIGDSLGNATVRLKESACRIVFTSATNANNVGVATTISLVDSSTAIKIPDTLPSAISIGDEFVIIPANTLLEYRTLYNATTSKATSQHTGLSNLPKLVTYVHAFEEDTSAVEDSSIQSSSLGFETTHRMRLRWCLRVAMYYESQQGDTYLNIAQTALSNAHIFRKLSDSKNIEFQALIDSVDTNASLNAGYLQTALLRNTHPTTGFSDTVLGSQASPYSESSSITPMHLFSGVESQKQYLMWAFLKCVLVNNFYDGDRGAEFGTDIQIINMFHSESKSLNANASNETLSEYFFPGMFTDFTVNTAFEHAWLSNINNYKKSVTDTQFISIQVTPPSYLTPPRVMMTHADLSTDNYDSRGLFGKGGGVLSDSVAPLVFNSLKSHMSFVDQVLLGSTGLGQAIGSNNEGEKLESFYDYFPPTSANPDTSVSGQYITQSGYGSGSIKMVDILSGATPEYYLRDKGNLSSHTIGKDHSVLGWSFYKKQGNNLGEDSNLNKTDLSVRNWHEGIGQTLALRESINFRKLAIKTVAHKSMDLFTISVRPLGSNDESYNQAGNIIFDESSAIHTETPNKPIMLPFKNGTTDVDTQNAFNDSYGGLSRSHAVGYEKFNASLYIPSYKNVANKEKFEIKALLDPFVQDNKGTSTFKVDPNTTSIADNQNDYGNFLGPWNRFAFSDTAWARSIDSQKLKAPMDTWANRCTAMRLRYHIGDFYPNGTDSRGTPKNLLVDSLNLFVRIEPLSLAHWMTMPKHQHSVLENSLVLADGIEALLKVSHGLGDVQKLLNSSSQPLIQDTSPYKTETVYDSSDGYTTSARANVNVGDVDPKDLPFGYENQPFVHWYHPAQESIRSDYIQSETNKFTIYPKFGRRSLIIPAITPNDFYYPNRGGVDLAELLNYDVADQSANKDSIGDINIWGLPSDNTDFSGDIPVSDSSILGYAVHATNPQVGNSVNPSSVPFFQINDRNNGVINADTNAIVFPYLPDEHLTHNSSEDDYFVKSPSPVFLPANRFYIKQASAIKAASAASGGGNYIMSGIGFHPVIASYGQYSRWELDSKEDSYIPYSERDEYWTQENSDGANVGALPKNLQEEFDVWTVPVMRAAIRTTTVAGIVDLVRTSFETGLDSSTVPSEYNFTMPSTTYDFDGTTSQNKVPGIGPDLAVDTLFVGDTGTALSQVYKRTGFISPLTLGMGAITTQGNLVHNNNDSGFVIRDSFDLYFINNIGGDLLSNVFAPLNNMGMQIKLLMNCSLRVLHTRPAGRERLPIGNSLYQTPAKPRSLTEVFIAHDRTLGNMSPVTLPTPDDVFKKPYLHLATMNKSIAATSSHPNYPKLSHLYSMYSDSIGGPQSNIPNNHLGSITDANISSPLDLNGLMSFDSEVNQRVPVGDTFVVDPYDYDLHAAISGSSKNPLQRDTENTQHNSGIEIDLIKELDMIHETPANYNLNASITYNSTAFNILNTMPTSAELTLPGDHELVFVLYTGHYGANMYDDTCATDTTHIPPVAGCHITATLEVNRPSERISSTDTDEHHYNQNMSSSNAVPINTYSILSTK